MVENDVLIFESKLKNAIKHSIGRRVIKIQQCTFKQGEVVITIQTPDCKDGFIINVPEKYSLKDAVCYALHFPQLAKYLQVQIVDTVNVQKEMLKSFSNQNIPESFEICKIPKKQIQVKVGNKKDYINISLQSYQRVLSRLDHIKKWPAKINCKDFMTCFTRREFVTILLQISQLTL